MPIFATQILHLTPAELGLLFSASGVGTILGALIVASLGDVRRKGLLLLGALAVWVAALVVFALSHVVWLSLVALLLFGMAQITVGTMTITLLQTRVPPEMRGRVMSLNTLLVMGVRPLGDFPAGALISVMGAPPTVLLGAALIGGYTLYLATARPVLRRL